MEHRQNTIIIEYCLGTYNISKVLKKSIIWSMARNIDVIIKKILVMFIFWYLKYKSIKKIIICL